MLPLTAAKALRLRGAGQALDRAVVTKAQITRTAGHSQPPDHQPSPTRHVHQKAQGSPPPAPGPPAPGGSGFGGFQSAIVLTRPRLQEAA